MKNLILRYMVVGLLVYTLVIVFTSVKIHAEDKELKNYVHYLEDTISANECEYAESLYSITKAHEEEVILLEDANKRLEEENEALEYEIGICSSLQEISWEDVDLMCRVIQCEAGEGNYESQRVICAVILNRLYSPDFPDNIHDVLYAKRQFTVVPYAIKYKEVDPYTVYLVHRGIENYYEDEIPDNVLYFVGGNSRRTHNRYAYIEGTTFFYGR